MQLEDELNKLVVRCLFSALTYLIGDFRKLLPVGDTLEQLLLVGDTLEQLTLWEVSRVLTALVWSLVNFKLTVH